MRWPNGVVLAVVLASTLGACGNDFDYGYGQGVARAQQQGYDPDDQVECHYGGFYFGAIEVLPAAVCMQHSKGLIYGPMDSLAYEQKQQRKAEQAQQLAQQQRLAQEAQQAGAAQQAAAATARAQVIADRKAARKQREAAISHQLAIGQSRVSPSGGAVQSTQASSSSSPGVGAPSQAALSELQSLVSTSGAYELGGSGTITYYGRIFSISPTGIDYGDGNKLSFGGENWFHHTATWADLRGDSVTVGPGEEGPSISRDGKSSYAVSVSGRQSSLTVQIFTADSSVPNRVADLLRSLTRGGSGGDSGSGSPVTVSVDANALGDDNGANIVRIRNTSNHAIKLSAWTANCSNLEVANCGNVLGSAPLTLAPGRETSFWVNRDDDSQPWSYTVQCTVDGASGYCGTGGGGGPASAS